MLWSTSFEDEAIKEISRDFLLQLSRAWLKGFKKTPCARRAKEHG
jgi:hypothetical protein